MTPGIAQLLAQAVVYQVADAGVLNVDGQSHGNQYELVL
jgi:hypothetical protein